MRLEELRDLREAEGLLILTTADDDGLADSLIGNGFSVNVVQSNRSRGLWWMFRSAGDYKANFRYHPHNSKLNTKLQENGFITRIDFFVSQPTGVVYDVVSALLKRGFRVAIPKPAGTHTGTDILSEWETFEPTKAVA